MSSNAHHDHLGDTHSVSIVLTYVDESNATQIYPIAGLTLDVVAKYSGQVDEVVTGAIVSSDELTSTINVTIPNTHASAQVQRSEYRLRAVDGAGHRDTLAVWDVIRT